MISHKLIQVNFENGGHHFIVRVGLNGKPALMLVDTSAAKTVLDLDHSQKYVSKPSLKRNTRKTLMPGAYSVFSYNTVLDELEIGNIILKDFPTAIVDMSTLNRDYRSIGIPQVDGVLGCDVLFECKAKIDFENRELIMGKWDASIGSTSNEVID